jgi:hypothetical protein
MYLNATDIGSGIAQVSWRLTDLSRNVTSPWQIYRGPFQIQDLTTFHTSGLYRLDWFATDVANNREPVRNATILVDNVAPHLTARFDGSYLYVNATVPEALADVFAGYRNATETTWHIEHFAIGTPDSFGGAMATGPIPRGNQIDYFVGAVDRLGNKASIGTQASPVVATAPPHPPILSATLPLDGISVNGTIHIPWAATDPDKDPMQVLLKVRPTLFGDTIDLANSPGTAGNFSWDSTQYPDGEYEILVIAADPFVQTNLSTVVEVENTATGAFHLLAPKGAYEYGDAVHFGVTVYKPLRNVSVLVTSEDGSTTSVPLVPLATDAGANAQGLSVDGVYAATWVPYTKGTFHASLVLDYLNEPTAQQALPNFLVQATLLRTMGRDAVPIGIGALSLVGIAAVVVVQLLRFGYLFPK